MPSIFLSQDIILQKTPKYKVQRVYHINLYSWSTYIMNYLTHLLLQVTKIHPSFTFSESIQKNKNQQNKQ